MGSAITRANPPIPAGTGGATYKPSGVIHVTATQAATTAVTTEETLFERTLTANTLATTGDSLRITMGGYCALNANTKTIKFKFGATTYTVNNSTTAPQGAWVAQYIITRTSATTQVGLRPISQFLSTAQGHHNVVLTADLATDVTVAITGTNGTASAGDIRLDYVAWEFL